MYPLASQNLYSLIPDLVCFFWYVLLKHQSVLEFHNYFIWCPIVCGVVHCGICII